MTISLNPWQSALNPAIYSAAVIPVLVGTAVAYQQTGQFNIVCFGLSFVGLVLIQAWINLTNDVWDDETGVDQNKPWSLVQLTGDAQQVFWVGTACLVLGAGAFGGLAWFLQDGVIIVAATIGCGLGYFYQAPPFRLAYKGWGELISFTCFGPIAVLVTTYAQLIADQTTPNFTPLLVSFAASLIVGTLTSLILYTHHFPQIADDREAGKLSPIVRWGTKLAAERLAWLILALYGSLLLFWLAGLFPWVALVVLGTVPLSLKLYNWVNVYHDQPESVAQAMPIVIQLHFWGGVLLSAGFVVGRFFT